MDEDTEAALMRAGAQIVALQREAADSKECMHAALRLVTDLRLALGDEGSRMQPELIEHAAALRKDAERYRKLRTAALHSSLCPVPTLAGYAAGRYTGKHRALIGDELDSMVDAM